MDDARQAQMKWERVRSEASYMLALDDWGFGRTKGYTVNGAHRLFCPGKRNPLRCRCGAAFFSRSLTCVHSLMELRVWELERMAEQLGLDPSAEVRSVYARRSIEAVGEFNARWDPQHQYYTPGGPRSEPVDY